LHCESQCSKELKNSFRAISEVLEPENLIAIPNGCADQ
jgi:hypothetical protein